MVADASSLRVLQSETAAKMSCQTLSALTFIEVSDAELFARDSAERLKRILGVAVDMIVEGTAC